MSETQVFKVCLIGIAEKDRQMLDRLLKLRIASGVARSYVLTKDSEPEPDKLFVVNSDNDDSIAFWCRRFLGLDKEPKVPTVFAGRRKVKASKTYQVDIPFKASQILSVFDTITVKEMNYIPELTIGRAADDTNLSSTFLEEIANDRLGDDYRFTAMVVDDSQPVRKQLEIELKMMGARVELAENGEQALALSRDRVYDIIFLDVVMPGMDGYKVCKSLKKDVRS
ncbi:MAG: response regulator, partial [Gammaproteobacteria bacterium]